MYKIVSRDIVEKVQNICKIQIPLLFIVSY